MRRPGRATPWLVALALGACAVVAFLLRPSGAVRLEGELDAIAELDVPRAPPAVLVVPSGEVGSTHAIASSSSSGIGSTDAIESSTTSAASERTVLAPAPPIANTVLAVRAVADDDDEPLAGVRIRIRGDDSRTKRTDASGRIETEVVPGVSHELTVLASDEEVSVDPLAPGERRELVWRLSAIELRGRVVARGSGTPIGGARLTLASVRRSAWAGELVSDDFGAFRVRLPTGPAQRAIVAFERSWRPTPSRSEAVIELVARAPGWASSCDLVRLPSQGDAEVVVQLARAPTLVVRAIDETGKPLEDAHARVTAPAEAEPERPTISWRENCDADGAFEIDDAPVGESLRIVVDAGKRRVEQTFEALEPGEYREVVVTLGMQVSVVGTVLDQDGEPVRCELWMVAAGSDAAERYFHAGEEPDHSTRSFDDGRFRITHVRPGRWWIGPRRYSFHSGFASPGYVVSTSASAQPAPWAQLVTIDAGSEQSEVILVLNRVGVAGTVVGDRLLFLTRLRARSLVGEGSIEGRCAETGEFHLELGPGPHELIAHHPRHGSTAPMIVSGDDVGLVLRLPVGVHVRGRVLGANGSSGMVTYSAIDGHNRSTAPLSAEGAFDLGTLAPGRYRVVAITDDRIGCAEVEIAESSAEIEISLAQTGELVVHWDWEASLGLSLAWGDVEIAERYSRRQGEVLTRSPAVLPAPVGIPLELSILGSQRRATIVVPPSGRLELDLTAP